MPPKMLGKTPTVTLSPGKEKLTAIGQFVQNAPTQDPHVPTSYQSTTHPSIETGVSAAAVMTPDPIQAPDNSETMRASARSKKATRLFGVTRSRQQRKRRRKNRLRQSYPS